MLINRYKNPYPRCSSLEVQASSDFTWSRAVKILSISLQYLSALLLDPSAISLHSPVCLSNFPLSICSCWIVTFSSLASYSAIRLLSDSVATRCSHLLISRLNLILTWCRSSIFATKLTSGLGNSRDLFGSQQKVELRKISSAYRLFPILCRKFWLKRGLPDGCKRFIDTITQILKLANRKIALRFTEKHRTRPVYCRLTRILLFSMTNQ